MTVSRPYSVIDRASPGDRAFLAMSYAPIPPQFGVVLLLDQADDLDLDLATVRRLVDWRIRPVRRLRQRLVHVPIGCGGPIWIDDADFDVEHHVSEVRCRPPGNETAVLETVTALVTRPLPRDAPLWSAALITGLAEHRVGLVIVLHHVLADGVGGLAVLRALADTDTFATGGERGTAGGQAPFPQPRPSVAALAHDAFDRRWRGLRHIGVWWRDLVASMTAGGGLRPARAQPCSLLVGTGTSARAVSAQVERERLRAAAHGCGATVNDAVLVAVAGALDRVLHARGEHVDRFAVVVPVSGRGSTGDGALGNMVAPLLVSVPTTGDPPTRLLDVTTQIHRQRAAATGPPPIAVLGGFFRPFAALGGYRWYMRHQHRVHTLVSHVRGPAEPVTIAGHPVRRIIPVSVGEAGNMTVAFDVLSYSGELTVTAVVDAEHFTDEKILIDGLRDELDEIMRVEPAPGAPAVWLADQAR